MRFAKVFTLAAAALVLFAVGAWSQDFVQEGKKFWPGPTYVRDLMARSVDSLDAGSKVVRVAGSRDSAYFRLVNPPRLPNGLVMGGIYIADSSGVLFHFDGSQNLLTTDASRDRDANLTFTNIINNYSLAQGAADSSAVLDTHTMRLGMLLIDASPVVSVLDTTSTIRLAFSIRCNLLGGVDSSSVFPIYEYANAPITSTVAQGDTINVGHLMTPIRIGGVAAAVLPRTAWSGEFIVTIAANRMGLYNNAAVNGKLFNYPKGIAIPLSNLFGRDVYIPYMSVRVWNVWSTGTAALPCKVAVHYVGTPL